MENISRKCLSLKSALDRRDFLKNSSFIRDVKSFSLMRSDFVPRYDRCVHRHSSQFPPTGLIGSSETSLAGRIAGCEETGDSFYSPPDDFMTPHHGIHRPPIGEEDRVPRDEIGKIVGSFFGTGAHVEGKELLFFCLPFSLFSVVSRPHVAGIPVMRNPSSRGMRRTGDGFQYSSGEIIHRRILFTAEEEISSRKSRRSGKNR